MSSAGLNHKLISFCALSTESLPWMMFLWKKTNIVPYKNTLSATLFSICKNLDEASRAGRLLLLFLVECSNTLTPPRANYAYQGHSRATVLHQPLPELTCCSGEELDCKQSQLCTTLLSSSYALWPANEIPSDWGIYHQFWLSRIKDYQQFLCWQLNSK